jgi:glutamate N-acetyltransferase/amino-acid N-acetyltransferase
VKAALYGGDPNWGRIVQAIGGALGGEGLGGGHIPVDVFIEGIQVCAAGVAIDCDEADLVKAVERQEVEYEINLPGDGAETEVFFSDLSYEYVRINAEYTT